MLALITIVLLSLFSVIGNILRMQEWVISFYLGSLTLFIIKEYFRRMKYAGIIPTHKAVVAFNLFALYFFQDLFFTTDIIPY